MTEINQTTLAKALSKMLNTPVKSAAYTLETLHGGTLGDVAKLTGEACTANGNLPNGNLPFTIVLKIQKSGGAPVILTRGAENMT